MKQILLILAITAFLVIIAALDVAFFPAIGGMAGQLNLALILSLFLLIIVHPRIAIVTYVLTTIIVGLTSASHIVLPMVTGVLVLLIINNLFEQFFTNRSYYTLVGLGTLGWYLYYVLFAGSSLILSLFTEQTIAYVNTGRWWLNVLFLGILTAILYSVAYFSVHFTSRRFQSYFITSSRPYE